MKATIKTKIIKMKIAIPTITPIAQVGNGEEEV